jgi:hypothetical protein
MGTAPLPLPPDVRAKLGAIPESSMGAQRVTVELSDGRSVADVYIAGQAIIVRVGTSDDIPFDPSEIVDVSAAPD